MQQTTRLLAGALLAGLLGAAGCADDDDLSIDVEPGPVSTLSGIVSVSAAEPVRLGVTAVADGHEVRIPPPAEAAADYELPLVGLRPETTYRIELDGTSADAELSTGPLPDDFPPLELEVDAERAADGVTLLSLKPWGDPTDDNAPVPEAGGYLAAVDHDGYVVWYHPTELGVLDARQLPNGNLLFTYDEVVVREVDVLGRTVRELAGTVAVDNPADFFGRARTTEVAVPMATDSAHHDAGPTPHGTILLLSTELLERTGPPRCGEAADEATYRVISDIVVEVEPDTGEILGEWRLADVYDPFDRPGTELCVQGSTFAPPNFFYNGGGVDVRDWTHGNSVVLDEDRNALIVSLRHLSAVLALRYADDDTGPAGELLWELGPDGSLALDGEPSTYQHAAEVLDDGAILVYDNGNARATAPLTGGGGAPYSRGVIYEVDDRGADPAAWTATQVWEHVLHHDDGRPVFTAFLGDADGLDNGNVLLTHGAITDADGRLTARIVEVDRDRGDVVFDLRVGDVDEGWTVYRSERLPTLVPDSPVT